MESTVFWFDISVYHSQGVYILDTRYDLPECPPYLRARQGIVVVAILEVAC